MSGHVRSDSTVTRVDVVDEKSENAIVALCEEAAACMRLVVQLTEVDEDSPAREHPADTHRALSAIEVLLDRLTRALAQIAHAATSQILMGEIAMDVGTPYVDDVSGAATEISRLLAKEASPALDIAAIAVDGARALLAHASLRPTACA
ncbi:MAG: hypothetical protein QOH29_244, partial [Actinomycetota bacterium]|nr:hypothetical protein [Actinomycetota bacterium]